ncbi:hypothetical protein [Clostridium cibarium]|uniref:DUF1878 family protein n=1 Tax=Clostridium cibarium TaxID=2762247 RepID=A0ABR8PXA8_9CLOT|nr:hypothetical protein [Clostridium cibarium]MBD7912783.1 hypothetical protein [Clostridium cibarium]
METMPGARDEKYELLKYQIKILQLMLSSVTEDKFAFYNFVIDHNITEQKVSIILNGLSVLKDRIAKGKVSQNTKAFYGENLSSLFIDASPTYKEYENFVQTYIDGQLNTRYLLLALKRQGIHKEVCDYLLEDMKK